MLLFFFNPFNYIDRKSVIEEVEKLYRRHPDLDRRELCGLLIKKYGRYCAISGAFTALPAVVPVFGTLLVLLGGTAFDMAVVTYYWARMIMAMATVYGRDPYGVNFHRETLWVFASAAGADVAGKSIGKMAAKQMNNQFVVKILQDILLSMGIRSTQRAALRVIPLLGCIAAGWVNYFISRKVGKVALEYYERHRDVRFGNDVVIDVEGQVE